MILLSPLYEKPNHVVERQKLYQLDTRPVYLRLPRSRLYVGLFGALFMVGMVSTSYGVTQLVKGKQESK